MRLPEIIAFLTLLIAPCIAAPEGLSVATTYHYQSHGIAFDIPENWSLVSDQWNNRTQIDGTLITDGKMELTDNQSTIRIDVVDCPQMAWFIDATGWETRVGVDSLARFYEKAILNRLKNDTHGRGTPYKDYSFMFYYNDSEECKEGVDPLECKWKPEICKESVLVKPLNNQLIGIYGNFNGTYEAQEIGMMKYPMLQPLYEIANSLKPIR